VVDTKECVHRILGAVGADVEDEDWLDLLFVKLEGKDVTELLTAGREQLAYTPSGAAVAVAGFEAPAAAGGAEAKEEDNEEDK
jgi:large subunit ribosomal protein LP2